MSSGTRNPQTIRPTPDDLADPARYVLVDEIAHDQLMLIVQKYLKRASAIVWAYIGVNAALVIAMSFVWITTRTPLLATLPNVCIGMCLGYLVLMPIHEWIHALTYRWLGAARTRVVFNWRNLSAYCVADQFVVTGREFVLVALAPFLVINSILLILIAAVGGFSPILWGMSLLHAGACSGDFAFVNYVWVHRPARLFTYDDVAGKMTYFFADLLVNHSTTSK